MVVLVIILRAHGEATVVVYDSKIDAMNFPGGMVHEYVRDRTNTARDMARAFAPVRSGTLVKGIGADVRPRTTSVVGRVRARARHSQWVHEGTKDKEPITAASGGLMYLPAGGGYSARRLHAVRGQRAQPFLVEGMEAALATPYTGGVKYL